MRLNWFSPLPPARTGIAEYTIQVLPALRAQAEVVLWTDQEDWDRELAPPGEVRRYQATRLPWDELDRADLNIYQIGNSPFHKAIWHVSHRCPGLVVLHDLNLTDLCRHALPGPEKFADAISLCYGEAGRRVAEPLRTGRVPSWTARHLPMTEAVVRDALGVVVHTRKAGRALGRLDIPVKRIPLPFPATEWPAQRPGRPTTPGDPYQLIIFGHLDFNRGLDKVLQALAAFPWRERFRLNLFGEVAHREHVEEMIRSLGLEPLVRLHGHVADGVLDAALAWSDLAINLRYPTMGEASHSQLRLWNHGMPSVVTKVGWYAELPADAVAWVRPGEEVADLQGHLLGLLRDPDSFRAMGLRGRLHLQRNHTAERYARELVQFVNEVTSGDRWTMKHHLRTAVADAMRGWETGEIGDSVREGAFHAMAGVVDRAPSRTNTKRK